MAFNLHFFKGATIHQIRDALAYQNHLITAEQEEQLKKEKAIIVENNEVPKPCNEVVVPDTPAGAVGVPYQPPPPRRLTGTNIYHDN
jgi:hypothetical protein